MYIIWILLTVFHGLIGEGNPCLSPDGGIACRFSVHTSLEGRREDLPFAAPPRPPPPAFPAPQLPPLRPPPPPPLRPPPPPPPPPPILEHVSWNMLSTNPTVYEICFNPCSLL